MGRLAARFGEARLAAAGTFLSAIALGFLPYSRSLGAMLGFLALLALGQGVTSPALSSLVSKLVDKDEVGGTMGIYQGLSSLGRIAGPFWGELVFGRWGFQWPYRTGSLVMLAASAVALVVMARLRRRPATDAR